MTNVRVRFAPSPTGYLHIGGLRTALYDYLFAKQAGGTYVLRIEDTDRNRFVDDAMRNLIESLTWAGVVHDEGVFINDKGEIEQRGEYGPYIQSERLEIYKEYLDRLIESGHAYPCFCSKERLESVREAQRASNEMIKYDGHCRNLSKEEAAARIAAGEEYVVRLRMPENTDIAFDDTIRGHVSINSDDVDDQVLMKSDGFPTYHLAAVVDDHLMEISHVVRGEEWLPSTPKHIYLNQCFGWEAPQYVHLPTVLNKEKKKLSKRHGDVAVGDFRKKGYTKEGLINYLALVGWSPEGDQEIFSMEELIEAFHFERVSKAGGVFDVDKLNWVNAQHIRKMTVSELTDLCAPYLIEAGKIDESVLNEQRSWLERLVSTVQERIELLSDVVDRADLYFREEVIPETEEVAEMLRTENIPVLIAAMREDLAAVEEIDDEFMKGFFKRVQKATGLKGKNLYMPSRAMITGQLHGPDMAAVFVVMGKAGIERRLAYVEENFTK